MKENLINMSEPEVLNALKHNHLSKKDLKLCRLECKKEYSYKGKVIFRPMQFYTLWVSVYADDIVQVKGIFVAVPGEKDDSGSLFTYFVPLETFADITFREQVSEARIAGEDYVLVCDMAGLRYLVPRWCVEMREIIGLAQREIGKEHLFSAIPRIIGPDFRHAFPAWVITWMVGMGPTRQEIRCYFDIINQRLVKNWFVGRKKINFLAPVSNNQKAYEIGKTLIRYKKKRLIFLFRA